RRTYGLTSVSRDQRAWLYWFRIFAPAFARGMASRAASQTQARATTQTAFGTQAQETAPFLAWRRLPDDLTTLETHRAATAPGCADEPQRGPPCRLPLEPGVCHQAQRTSGGGIGLLA